MSRGRRLPQAERRNQLIAVATTVFAESGYRTASMDDVADAAGVSKPVLYQHFDSKQALYLAVIDVAAESFNSLLLPALDTGADNRERIAETFRAYFAFITERRDEFFLLFRSDAYEAEAQRKVDEVRQIIVERTTAVVAENTLVTPAEAQVIGRSITGMAEYAAFQFVETPELSGQPTAEMMTYLLWRGVSGFPTTVEEAERYGGNTRPWDRASATADDD